MFLNWFRVRFIKRWVVIFAKSWKVMLGHYMIWLNIVRSLICASLEQTVVLYLWLHLMDISHWSDWLDILFAWIKRLIQIGFHRVLTLWMVKCLAFWWRVSSMLDCFLVFLKLLFLFQTLQMVLKLLILYFKLCEFKFSLCFWVKNFILNVWLINSVSHWSISNWRSETNFILNIWKSWVCCLFYSHSHWWSTSNRDWNLKNWIFSSFYMRFWIVFR